MAVKKVNVYDRVNKDSLLKEVSSIIEFLESVSMNEIVDDIEFKVTAKGGLAPSIVSTIEKKVDTYLNIIQQCAKIAISLLEKEETLTPFLESMIFVVTEKLKEIQVYYENRPIKGLEHRKLSKEIGKTKEGKPKIITFLVQTKEDIIKYRTKFTEKILATEPLIEQIKEEKEKKLGKGDKPRPLSMLID